MRRYVLYLLLALAGLLVLAGVALWELLQADSFWRWSGRRLVAMAQERLQGEVRVREVQGTPLAGLVFRDVTVTGPQGPALQAEQIRLRFSPWSFLKLKPVVSELVLVRPHLTVRQDQEGRWQWLGLRPPWGPGETPAPLMRSLELSRVQVERGEIDILRPGGRWQARDLDLELTLTVRQPMRAGQTITVRRVQGGATTDWGRLGLKGRLSYARGRLDLQSLMLTGEDRPLCSVAGGVGLAPGAGVSLDLQLGPLPGGFLRRFWPRWPEAWDLGGKFSLTGSMAELQVTGEGALKNAAFTVQGQVQPGLPLGRYDLSLGLARLTPDLLADLNRAWEARVQNLGAVSARVRLQGAGEPWSPRELQWRLECQPFAYQTARVEELRLVMTGDGQAQNLEGSLAGNFGRVQVKAGGNILASRAGELKIKGDGLDFAALGRPDAGGPVSGTFTGRFRLPGAAPPSGPWLAGDLEAQGQIAQQPLRALKGNLTWDGAKLELARANLNLGPVAADFRGFVDGRGLDFHGRGSLAAEAGGPWLPEGWKGRLEGEGALKGPWAAPQFTLQAQGRGLRGEGLQLESLKLQAAGHGWPPQAGSLELQAAGLETLMGTYAQVRLSSRGEGGRWRFELQGTSPEEGPQAVAKGTADLSFRPFGLALEQWRLSFEGITAASAGPMNMRLSPGWEIAPATFKVNDGLVNLQMQARPGHLSGRLEADSLPAGLVCIQGVPCQGRIKALATLNGDPMSPAIQGQLTLGPGQWGDFAFRLFHTSFGYREGNFTVSGSLEEKVQGPRLTWDGRVPLRLTLLPPRWAWGERDMHFRLQGEKANLALLTALTPEVTGAEGSLDILAEWQGDPRHPLLSGAIRWGSGYLSLRQAGGRFRLQPGQARFQGESLTVPEIVLENEGTARITGTIALAGFRPSQFDLRAQLQDFLGLSRTGSQARATGSATLRGPWLAPVLSGHLRLSQAVLTLGFFQTGIHKDIVLVQPPPPPKPGPALISGNLGLWKNLRMDMGLEAPSGVWLRDKRINVEFAGNIKAIKPAGGRIYVAGKAHALRGTYELQGKDFKVEKGLIHLPGRPGEEATMDGQAVHKMANLTLVLNATGPVIKPQVKLESIPPLPPSDLLSYLVFSRPAAGLSREEYLSLGQAAVGVLGGITAQKVQELLGKDFPVVGNVTLKGGQSEGRQLVGVTKPLTQDLSVSFERKTSPLYRDDTNQVRLEYKLHKHLSVESQMGRRNTGADVLFNLDF